MLLPADVGQIDRDAVAQLDRVPLAVEGKARVDFDAEAAEFLDPETAHDAGTPHVAVHALQRFAVVGLLRTEMLVGQQHAVEEFRP